MKYEITGLDYLSDFSGKYDSAELARILEAALESSKSLFDFDNLIEGKADGGFLLSGYQLLAVTRS